MRLEERLKQIVASPSKSFAAALVCFSLGVAAATVAGRSAVATPFAVAIVGSVAAALVRERRARLVAVLVACFALGVWRFGLTALPPSARTVADAAVGADVAIEGRVAAEVEPHGRYRRVVLDDVRVPPVAVEGKMLVWLDAEPPVSYGDAISLVCAPELPQPVDGFAYDRSLRAQGIYAVCDGPEDVRVESRSGGIVATLLSVKRVVVARLGQIVPEPHASFLAGLLFGGSSSLSRDLKDDFSKTGTSHVLAASGFNVSLFSMVFLTWITHSFLGRRRGAYLTAALLVAYVCVAGATAAVVRAGIMGLLVLVGFVVRRKPSILNVTLLALAAMLLWNPLLLSDVGFQLSFVATAAMLGASGAIEKRCVFVPEAFELRASFAGSLAAIVFTLPIMLWHFGTVSPWSPVVNLLVLPIVPMLMAFTGVALAAGFLNVALGTVVAIPAWAASSVLLHVIAWFGAI